MNRPERFINSLDFQFQVLTVVIDMSHIYGKGQYPTQREINAFIADDLAITASMICGIQYHPRFPKVFIQLEKVEQVTAVELKLQGGVTMTGKDYKVYGYRCDRPMVNIVLNGQDMSIGRDEVVRVLSNYGVVMHCERGKNNDLSEPNKFVHDGTWIVKLTPEIKTKPPETIYYFGRNGEVQTWILSFEGMGSSCVLCGRQGHKGYRCNAISPRNGKLGRQPAGLGLWTDIVYSDAVAAPAGQPEGGHVQAGHVQHLVNLAQGKQSDQLKVPASQGRPWGKLVPEPRPGPSGTQNKNIPGLWIDPKPKRKPRNRKKNTNNDVSAASNNRFAILNDEDTDDGGKDDTEPEVVEVVEHPENSQDWNQENKGKSKVAGVFGGKNSKRNWTDKQKKVAISKEKYEEVGKVSQKKQKKGNYLVPRSSSLVRYGVKKSYQYNQNDFLIKNKKKNIIEEEKKNEKHEKKRHHSNTIDDEIKKKMKIFEKKVAIVDVDKAIDDGTKTSAAERADGLDGMDNDEMIDDENVKIPEVPRAAVEGSGDEEIGGVGAGNPPKPDKEVMDPGSVDGVGIGETSLDNLVEPKEVVEDDNKVDKSEHDASLGTPTSLPHPLVDDEEQEIAEMAAKLKRQLKDKNLN